MLVVASRDFFLPKVADEEAAQKLESQQLEQELTLIALLGISDPLRPEVVPAIQQCNRAGITVRMLTGVKASAAEPLDARCHFSSFACKRGASSKLFLA